MRDNIPELPLEPEDEELFPVLYCDLCGEAIFEGDAYFSFRPDFECCEDCAHMAKLVATREAVNC